MASLLLALGGLSFISGLFADRHSHHPGGQVSHIVSFPQSVSMSVNDGEEKGSIEKGIVEAETSSNEVALFVIDPVKDKKLWRKLDRNLMPVVSVLFLLSFL